MEQHKIFYKQKNYVINYVILLFARDERIELPPTVLETAVLPLYESRITMLAHGIFNNQETNIKQISKINNQSFEISNFVIVIYLEIVSCILVILSLFHFFMQCMFLAKLAIFVHFQFFFDFFLIA